MEFIVFPLIMGILSAWAGGSLYGHQWFGPVDFGPELLFALVIAVVVAPLWIGLLGIYGYGAAGAVGLWSYIWMQTGHANALPWGDGNHNPDRENTLSPLVKKLSDKLGIPYFSKNYARLFMAIKGFIMTLPIGGLGLILWPLGYEIGHRVKNHAVSEFVAGAGVGLNLAIFAMII